MYGIGDSGKKVPTNGVAISASVKAINEHSSQSKVMHITSNSEHLKTPFVSFSVQFILSWISEYTVYALMEVLNHE